MPLDVDQTQRRQDVARAAAALIAERGMSAVTFRNLAAALGCSTTAISHYFPNRTSILLETYRFVLARAVSRRAVPPGADPGEKLASLDKILPIAAEQWDDWVVWLCFWTEALFDPDLASEQKLHSRETRETIEAMLRTLGCGAEEARDLSQKVMTTIYGIAVQAAFDREHWTPEVQRRALREVLEPALPLADLRRASG
ncbi:MAG: TetR family transcriptional regulator [Alphaproteobacteria bacterium]|nr:TetR family transcriptional regulator [Alphaproteobacteria bacterium]